MAKMIDPEAMKREYDESTIYGQTITYLIDTTPTVDAEVVVRCQNCNWWHRHKSGDMSCGVCDKYAVSKNENGYCDEPLLEERKLPWKN